MDRKADTDPLAPHHTTDDAAREVTLHVRVAEWCENVAYFFCTLISKSKKANVLSHVCV